MKYMCVFPSISVFVSSSFWLHKDYTNNQAEVVVAKGRPNSV